MSIVLRKLTHDDIDLVEALSTLFGEAFDDAWIYTGNRTDAAYLQSLLGGDSFIAVVALKAGDVVGGIAAYELQKFEQKRSEIYIYDLAVSGAHRRQGIATGLIGKLKEIARERGAYAIFVQADTEPEDQPALALYTRLGKKAHVVHFDIPVD